MKLSVIIVNYNVEAYLEQCLDSVFTALNRVQGEVFVVDNQSTDDSVAMVQDKFPDVNLIANEENVGFSRANNQAIKEAKGEYVVLLNPDTVVGEDVFDKVCAFMDNHIDAGGLGVKMIDGTGTFLPESKRGLPTPAVAFYKIIGLTRLFPRSKVFGRYQLGHLAENEIAEIEILSGACMFLRKKTLDDVGLLDESFFMYGEDIDLSYRILLGGWKNYYFPSAKIIHYKGESTKKSSINYVLVFYNAMAIFAKKHFSSKGADLIGSLINAAIFLSAIVAIVARFLRKMILPLLDVGVFLLLTLTLTFGLSWKEAIILGSPTLLISILCGIYDIPIRLKEIVKGLAFSTLILILFSGFNPYFSWLALSKTMGIAFGTMLLTRILMHFTGSKGFDLRANRKHKILTVGSAEEAELASALLWQTHYGLGNHKHIETYGNDIDGPALLKRIKRQRIDEVIFCGRDISSKRIIDLMESARKSKTQFKIVSPGCKHIIGPNSIESKKDLFILKDIGIISASSKRSKRVLDMTLSIFLILSLPITYWFISARSNLFSNIKAVLKGSKSWVGYPKTRPNKQVTFRKPGILAPLQHKLRNANSEAHRRSELVYAKDYHYTLDLRAFLSGFKQLGR